MAVNDYTQPEGSYATPKRVVALFREKEDAYRAVSRLEKAGFTSADIGVMSAGETSTAASGGKEGVWDKLKNFFTGESNENVKYRDTVSGMNWDENRSDYYYRGINEGGALVSVSGARIEQARSILVDAGGDLRESGFEAIPKTTNAEIDIEEPDQTIQLRGEILRTFKERIQRGEVSLRKDVVTENQTVEVPVTREELVIERVPASEQQNVTGEIGTDQEIRVPLSEERARVEKLPVVKEEVRVGKRAVQGTERVSDEVRREELRVDKDKKLEEEAEGTRKGKKPAA
jgi:uncharacterized protein (TIGR02271 family)